jgi:hypothetical protein
MLIQVLRSDDHITIRNGCADVAGRYIEVIDGSEVTKHMSMDSLAGQIGTSFCATLVQALSGLRPDLPSLGHLKWDRGLRHCSYMVRQLAAEYLSRVEIPTEHRGSREIDSLRESLLGLLSIPASGSLLGSSFSSANVKVEGGGSE